MNARPGFFCHRFYARSLVFATGMMLAAAPSPLLAAAGDLDPSFGSGGEVTTTIGTSSGAAGVAIQPDGKIVAAGHGHNGSEHDFAVVRYHENGAPDSGFGAGGVVATSFSGENDYGRAVVLQPDGKIVVAGYQYADDSPDFAVARYNSNGSLDSGFSGAGTTAFFFGADDYATAVALQSDGKIVVAGYTNVSGVGADDFALVRFNSNGTVDSGFGTGGKVTTSFTSGMDMAYAVLIQPDGKIVAAGFQYGNSSPDFAVARYNSNGSLDTSFSSDGKHAHTFGGSDTAYAAALQADGKIVLAGCTNRSGNTNVALIRLTGGGLLDTGFGSGGEVVTPVSISQTNCARAIAIQTDGKIVVTGYVVTGFLQGKYVLIRYLSNGVLDATFGSGGIVTTGPYGAFSSGAEAVAIQANGKIVVAGRNAYGIHLLRYEGVTIGLAVPTTPNLYTCQAAPAAPVVSTAPATAQPLAVTSPTPDTVRVILQTTAFTGPVDVYVGAVLPNGFAYLRTGTGWWPYPPSTGALTVSNVAAINLTSATDNLHSGPTVELLPGMYYFYVTIVPAGADPATFDAATSPHYSWCFTKTYP